MAMLAFQWSHIVASIWLYAGLLATATFLVAALVDWKQRNDRFLEAAMREKRSDQRDLPESEHESETAAHTNDE